MAALNPDGRRLEVPAALWEQMAAHVEACLPEEACGLLGGVVEQDTLRAVVVLPVENALHSPVRFRMQAGQQLQAMLWLEAASLELVGIFHSHPNGPDAPSETDLDEAAFPDAVQLIWSRREGSWNCLGWWIAASLAAPLAAPLAASRSSPLAAPAIVQVV